jgi:predicted nucleic acid-binding protein
MCIIVDANVASRVFAVPREDDFSPLWDWIENNNGKMVFGGKHGVELRRVGRVARRLTELWRAGLAVQVGDSDISREEKKLPKAPQRKSDDPHILALARASGARILCTNDGDLEADFKNLELVPRPKGKIYKSVGHTGLLGHNSICKGRPRKH